MTQGTNPITSALAGLAARVGDDLLALTEEEVAAEWYWRWEKQKSAEQNIYEFSFMLELHKRRCRRWEEHHNGYDCVVERVRDKYVMPRVREFLRALDALRAAQEPLGVEFEAVWDANKATLYES